MLVQSSVPASFLASHTVGTKMPAIRSYRVTPMELPINRMGACTNRTAFQPMRATNPAKIAARARFV